MFPFLISGCGIKERENRCADSVSTADKKNCGLFYSLDTCIVVTFFFSDVVFDTCNDVIVGPFRLLGVDEEFTCSSLIAPFRSFLNGFTIFNSGSEVNDVVALYSDVYGFNNDTSPCWRFYVVTKGCNLTGNLRLEVNYSYFYSDGCNIGRVDGMQRLPFDISGKIIDEAKCGIPFFYKLSTDENLPFSVACVCFAMSVYKCFLPI